MKTGVSTVPCDVCSRPDEHGVAVAVETIAGSDGLAIGRKHLLAPGEGRDQHEQGRFRQVEVGDEIGHHAELVAGQDQQIRAAARGRDRAAPAQAFQGAHHGGAHGHDGPALGLRAPEGGRGWLADHETLAVQMVAPGIVGSDRTEGARPHVQRDANDLVAPVLDLGEQLGREVQPRGRRRHCAGFLGIDGLVALAIVDGGPSRVSAPGGLDIGRQRHFAHALDGGEQTALPLPREAQHRAPPLPPLAQLGIDRRREPQPGTRRKTAQASQQHLPILPEAPGCRDGVARYPLDEQYLDATTRWLVSEDARRDHAGVVEDEERPAPKEAGELTEKAMIVPAVIFVKNE
jgi:hypothetical protein